MSKPGKVLKGLCKKLGVRLTLKRGKKRVYKSIKVLKAQCAKKKKLKKRKKVKKRKSKTIRKKVKKRFKRMVRFGAQGNPQGGAGQGQVIAPPMIIRQRTIPLNDLAIQTYNNAFMQYWYNQIPRQQNRARNPFQNVQNYTDLSDGTLFEVCRRYGPDFLNMVWVPDENNELRNNNDPYPRGWDNMSRHGRYAPSLCRPIFKSSIRRVQVAPENLNDGSNRMVAGFQIVFDPDYSQVVHGSDTINRSDSGLYINFYVILYQNIGGNPVAIMDNNGEPIKYHMYSTFHDNRQGMTPPGQPPAPLQQHANENNVQRRIHLSMRNAGENLPITNGNRYHMSFEGWDNVAGADFSHRQNQPYGRYSRTLVEIFQEVYDTVRKCRMVQEGNAPNGNFPIARWQDTQGCTPPPKPKPPIGILGKIKRPPKLSKPSIISKKPRKNYKQTRKAVRIMSPKSHYEQMKELLRSRSFGKKKKKKTKKISSQLKKLCKRLKIRLTVKRGKKRVYKSEKMLKAQCKKASSKKKKKVKRKRRSKFGPVNPATPPRESADAPSPSKELYGDEQDKLKFLTPGSSPSGPFSRRRRRSTGIRAGRPPPFNLYSPPSPPPFSLGDFGKKKKKKVKKRRKKVKRKKVKRKRKSKK